MAKKIVIGGVLAALAMFLWSSVAHVALPIGMMGLSTTPNEDAVLAAFKANLNEGGLYMLPAHGMLAAKSGADQEKFVAEWKRKYEGGAYAMVMYHPSGAKELEPRQLVVEFLGDVFAGTIIAFGVWAAAGRITGFSGRVLTATLLGMTPWFVVDVSQWNWYGYPTAYITGEALDQWIGALLAGVVLAWWFRKE
ncbi:MAG: hypothetical protein HYX26_09320 [Acidobacteriales bacterium]|nr:hypothetical protein [Terriglobales bacterium]